MRIRAPIALLAILVLGGCVQRELWPEERLDLKSAVNVTIMAEPWVYFHDVPMLVANARDYLNVGVVETNRAGTRACWLGVIAWSTINRSALPVPGQPVKPGRVKLSWPDESLELQPVAAGRESLGISEVVFAGPQPAFGDTWYALTTAQLSRLSRSPPPTVSLVRDDGGATIYQAWQIDPRVLAQFLEATGFTPNDR
jgi:hypothetical protein